MIGSRLRFRHPAPFAALLLLVLVLTVGCDTDTANSSNGANGITNNNNGGNVSPPTIGAAPPVQQNLISATPGQTGTAGTWTFALTEVNVYDSLPGGPGGATINPKQAFIVTRLRATNGGAAATHLALADFQLTDGKGHTYAPDAAAQAAFQRSKKGYPGPTQDVPAGGSGDMAIAFDAPTNMPGTQLVVQSQARFTLSP